jgi:hypothetical protein
MQRTQQDAIRRMTIAFYQAMPGAPMPPTDNGFYLWGDIEGNEHWNFCEAIATQIVRRPITASTRGATSAQFRPHLHRS